MARKKAARIKALKESLDRKEAFIQRLMVKLDKDRLKLQKLEGLAPEPQAPAAPVPADVPPPTPEQAPQ